MEKLKKILAGVLGIEENIINDNLSPNDVETWDSFNALMLVSELESAFNINFTMEEIMEIKNVKAIKDILTVHGVIFDE